MHYQDWTGRTFDHYRLDELIGSGGMGAVYRAHQLNLERDVAVKVLTYTADEVAAQRFYREARTIAALEHPHIVPIYDYGAREDVSYIAMRLLTGGSLEDRLQQHKNGLPLHDIATLAQQLGSALDYAHHYGVVHRDIKGSNVLFDPRGSAYLVDFGIAKLLQGSESSLTAEHLVMGTPTYMAPEVWQGHGFTPAADQYALGVLLFKMLVGMPPFMAASSMALMDLHLRHAVPDMLSLRSDLPRNVPTVMNRALAKQPEQRYPSVGAFAEALQAALRGASFAPQIIEPPLDSGATVPSAAVSSHEVTQLNQIAPHPNQPSSIPSPRPAYPQHTPPPPAGRRPVYPSAPQQAVRPQPPQPSRNPYAQPQPMQSQQPQIVRERVIVREGRQSPLMIMLWPFRLVWRIFAGIAGFIGSLFGTIIRQMLRSVVAFVMYLVLIIGTIALIIAFLVALVASNFQVGEAFNLLITQLTAIVQGFLPQ